MFTEVTSIFLQQNRQVFDIFKLKASYHNNTVTLDGFFSCDTRIYRTHHENTALVLPTRAVFS